MTPDATVEISIQRLDANREGAVALAAQIAVGYRGGRRGARRAVLQPPPCRRMARTRAAHVAAASVAVGRLADATASMLQG